MLTPRPATGRGRAHVQLLASVAANLGQHAVGHCVAMSSYILPQLQHTEHREDNQEITLSETQGSWFGNFSSMKLTICWTETENI